MPKRARAQNSKSSEQTVTQRKRTSPAPALSPEGSSLAPTVLKDKIAARAYELFLARGGHHGDDLADWFKAEAEVMETMNPGDDSTPQ